MNQIFQTLTIGIDPAVPHTLQFFGHAAAEHMERHGTKTEHFTKIAVKNRRHAVNNPYSQFQSEMSAEKINADEV